MATGQSLNMPPDDDLRRLIHFSAGDPNSQLPVRAFRGLWCVGSGGGGVALCEGVAVQVEDPAEAGFEHFDGVGVDAV